MRDHTEPSRIAGELRKAVRGPAWHGPAFLELLADVPPPLAARRGVPGAHSIWEITLHVVTWLGVVGERIDGLHRDVSDDEDWPTVVDESPAAWQQLLDRAGAAADRLATLIEQFPDDGLDPRLPGAAATGPSAYATLHGCVQHVLYHAGQIAILKKGSPA